MEPHLIVGFKSEEPKCCCNDELIVQSNEDGLYYCTTGAGPLLYQENGEPIR